MDVKKEVKTAGRTLSLFEAFYARKAPMTLTQLAAARDALELLGGAAIQPATAVG